MQVLWVYQVKSIQSIEQCSFFLRTLSFSSTNVYYSAYKFGIIETGYYVFEIFVINNQILLLTAACGNDPAAPNLAPSGLPSSELFCPPSAPSPSSSWLWFWFIPTQKRNNVWGEEAAGKALLVRHQCLAKDTIWKYLARRAWTDRCVMADLGDVFGPIQGARRISDCMDSITQPS